MRGFPMFTHTGTATPHIPPLMDYQGREEAKPHQPYALPHKQNRRAGYGNVFGALGELGLIVYSIPWGILMNGKNSH